MIFNVHCAWPIVLWCLLCGKSGLLSSIKTNVSTIYQIHEKSWPAPGYRHTRACHSRLLENSGTQSLPLLPEEFSLLHRLPSCPSVVLWRHQNLCTRCCPFLNFWKDIGPQGMGSLSVSLHSITCKMVAGQEYKRLKLYILLQNVLVLNIIYSIIITNSIIMQRKEIINCKHNAELELRPVFQLHRNAWLWLVQRVCT